jgi:hypothetical protein
MTFLYEMTENLAIKIHFLFLTPVSKTVWPVFFTFDTVSFADP